MAQMLRPTDSTERHLSASRRHIRRCRAWPGGQALAERIAPERDKLKKCQEKTLQRQEALEDVKDDLEMRGIEIADDIRTIAGRAVEIDRLHPGGAVFVQVFATGRFADQIRTDGTSTADDADSVVVRAAALGENHPLAPLAANLKKHAEAWRNTVNDMQEAERTVNEAEEQERIARSQLRRQYEDNYLVARKQFRAFCERLFPAIRGGANAAKKKPAEKPAPLT